MATYESALKAFEDAGLRHILILPSDSAAYLSASARNWSVQARLHPFFILLPTTASQVSSVLKVLAASLSTPTPIYFAIRSGGHSQWAGASSIEKGVVVDMSSFSKVEYSPETTHAILGSGAKWRAVFGKLEALGVNVCGGRDPGVGVGGFLTGGGNTYYSGTMGLACDSVVRMEVVLSTGEIVTASRDSSHPDLFRALKGGSGNFGIVTEFEIETRPYKYIGGGFVFTPREQEKGVIDAFVNFVDANVNNRQDALVVFWTRDQQRAPEMSIMSMMVNIDSNVDSPAFKEMLSLGTTMDLRCQQSMSTLTDSVEFSLHQNNVWFSLTLKNNKDVIQESVDKFKTYVKELEAWLPPTEWGTSILFQPLPAYFHEISKAKGGNVLGLEDMQENAVVLLIIFSTPDTKNYEEAHRRVKKLHDEIEVFANENKSKTDWLYLNYVDGTQKNPLSTYGDKSIKFMMEVAAKYDPQQLFQRGRPTGWKLCNV